MDALMQFLAAMAVVLLAVNTLVLVVLWSRLESRRDQIEGVERRVLVLEAHSVGTGEISRRLQHLDNNVAALNERSQSTQAAVLSIQEFLRDKE